VMSIGIGVSRGTCVVDGPFGEYVDVLGDMVSQSVRLSEKAMRLNVPVLAHKTAAAVWPRAFLQKQEPGVFSLNGQPKGRSLLSFLRAWTFR
jgi:class 3 adenylate cyclase